MNKEEVRRTEQKGIQNVCWHGRGGQGVVMAASILGTALVLYEGKYAFSIPSFGAERRGAPVLALNRISDRPIRRRDSEADPDYLVVLDDSLISLIIKAYGHGKRRRVILNSAEQLDSLNMPTWADVTVLDAELIGRDVFGRPIINTVMLGVLAAATGLVRVDSLKKAVEEVLAPHLQELNKFAIEAGYRAARKR